MTKFKLLAASSSALLILVVLFFLRGHWLDQGRQEVQARWNAQQTEMTRIALEQSQKRIERTREKENQLRTQNEQNQTNHVQRDQAIAADIDAAIAADQRLQHTIANAGANRMPAARSNACAKSSTDAATASARRELAQCSSEYRKVAATIDRLASQVIGLQDYARLCQGAH